MHKYFFLPCLCYHRYVYIFFSNDSYAPTFILAAGMNRSSESFFPPFLRNTVLIFPLKIALLTMCGHSESLKLRCRMFLKCDNDLLLHLNKTFD